MDCTCFFKHLLINFLSLAHRALHPHETDTSNYRTRAVSLRQVGVRYPVFLPGLHTCSLSWRAPRHPGPCSVGLKYKPKESSSKTTGGDRQLGLPSPLLPQGRRCSPRLAPGELTGVGGWGAAWESGYSSPGWWEESCGQSHSRSGNESLASHLLPIDSLPPYESPSGSQALWLSDKQDPKALPSWNGHSALDLQPPQDYSCSKLTDGFPAVTWQQSLRP